MSPTYSASNITRIANSFITDCRLSGNGSTTSVLSWLLDNGYKREDFYRTDLIAIHDQIVDLAKKYNLKLMPAKEQESTDQTVKNRTTYPYDIIYRIDNSKSRIKCPKCGSTSIANILYGLPRMDDRLEQEIANKRLILGGCSIITTHVGKERINIMPSKHCCDCRYRFDATPLAFNKDKTEAEYYRDIVTSITFSIRGRSMDSTELVIRKNTNGAIVNATQGNTFDFTGTTDKQLTKDQWLLLLDTLFEQMYLHEWRKSYKNNAETHIDGKSWELRINMTRGRKRVYRGIYCYTPYWKELNTLFHPYIIG